MFVLLWQPEVITVPRMCVCLPLCPQENNTSRHPTHLQTQSAQPGQVVPSEATKEKWKFPEELRLCNMNKLKGIFFF